MPARLAALVSPRARGPLVLIAAALLAVWRPLQGLREGWGPGRNDPAAWAERSFAELRPSARLRERIGVLVPPFGGESEVAYWYCAQYALAPALVEPVMLSACLEPRPAARCAAGNARRFALVNPDPALAALAEARLGIRRVGWAGSALLFVAEGR